MSETIQGRCQCGALRYQIQNKALACYTCHCQGCQRGAGGAYTLSLLLLRSDLEILEGEPSASQFSMPSGERLWHGCARCKSSLWYSSPAMPEFVAIKQGTLEESGRFQPVAHLWVKHKQAHVILAEDAHVFEEQPKFELLMKLWNERAVC